MSELKTCAHCGGDYEVEEWRHADWTDWRVMCGRCGASTDWYSSREFAIAAWNTRADEPVECYCIDGKCSRCGKDLPEPGYTGYEYEGNYCPMCGRELRGDSE